MNRMRWSAAMIVAAMCGAPQVSAQAVGGRCDIELRPATDSLRLTTTSSSPNGPRNVFIGGRVLAKCQNQDVRLLADSAEWYQQAQVLYLIGNVRYTEPRVRVSSDQMNYFQADERLLATGNVESTLPSGSIMRGPIATYYRAVRGLRPQSKLVAEQRPRLWLAQRDSAGKQSEPVQMTANQITTENDSLVFAGGKVEITRSDLDARSDSAFLDSGREFARLMVSPVIIGKGERGYTLRGNQVELYTRNRIVQRVLAQADARVTSEDMLLTADTIDLRVDRNRAQAAYVWGKSRARAVSPDRDLIADSLAVRMPDQQLREVRAFTNAVATTIPDTAKVRTGDKDWLKGDTIFAFFDSTAKGTPARTRADAVMPDAARKPAPVADTVAGRGVRIVPSVARADTTPKSETRPRMRELQSRGHASARYQVPAQGMPPERPAINYSRGDRITVVMDSSGVQEVQIDEHAVGLYLEPIRDSLSLPPNDSTARPGGAPGTIAPARTPGRPAAPVPGTVSRPAAVPPRSTPGRP